MIRLATKHDDPEQALGWGERIGFGMASCGRGMLTGVLGSFIMIYMMNVALLDAGILSIMFAVSRLIDGVSDIVIGNIVDHTRSKMGKARMSPKFCVNPNNGCKKKRKYYFQKAAQSAFFS